MFELKEGWLRPAGSAAKGEPKNKTHAVQTESKDLLWKRFQKQIK
jgi:hypothetical protein